MLRSRSAIIFDLDGTITRPYLNFDAIRAEIGLPPGPILEGIAILPVADQLRANAILDRCELEAAAASELQEDAVAVIRGIRRAGHPVAIMTRNSRVCTDHVLHLHGITVDFVRTRDDGIIKPSPEPVYAICHALNTEPLQSWVIGDFLFDIESGAQAGTKTVLMIGDDELPPFADQADHVIRRLVELTALLEMTRT